MLEERVGFFVMLEESTDEGYFQVYMHTDNEYDLDEEDLETLENEYGLYVDMDEDEQTLTIKKLLNITAIKEVQ
jgi:hypothetical protein